MRGGLIDARIELSVDLRRSSEGGLALDADGRAFGMAVFGPRRRTLVIPAATIDRVAATLVAKGRVARGYLGLGLQPVKLEGGGLGLMALSVDANGPGAAAGVKPGRRDRRLERRGRLRGMSPSHARARARQRRDDGQALAQPGRRAARISSSTIGERPQAK